MSFRLSFPTANIYEVVWKSYELGDYQHHNTNAKDKSSLVGIGSDGKTSIVIFTLMPKSGMCTFCTGGSGGSLNPLSFCFGNLCMCSWKMSEPPGA